MTLDVIALESIGLDRNQTKEEGTDVTGTSTVSQLVAHDL